MILIIRNARSANLIIMPNDIRADTKPAPERYRFIREPVFISVTLWSLYLAVGAFGVKQSFDALFGVKQGRK